MFSFIKSLAASDTRLAVLESLTAFMEFVIALLVLFKCSAGAFLLARSCWRVSAGAFLLALFWRRVYPGTCQHYSAGLFLFAGAFLQERFCWSVLAGAFSSQFQYLEQHI